MVDFGLLAISPRLVARSRSDRNLLVRLPEKNQEEPCLVPKKLSVV